MGSPDHLSGNGCGIVSGICFFSFFGLFLGAFLGGIFFGIFWGHFCLHFSGILIPPLGEMYTLPGNDHISHLKVAGKIIFLFHRVGYVSSQEGKAL